MIEVDVSSIAAYAENLHRISRQMEEEIIVSALKELAMRLLAKVKERTPVQLGHLRNSWTIGAVQKTAQGYEVEVFNPVEYASFVEEGHRQTPGRYVPAIGKRLKRSFVPGRYMLMISEREIREEADGIVEACITEQLRRILHES